MQNLRIKYCVSPLSAYRGTVFDLSEVKNYLLIPSPILLFCYPKKTLPESSKFAAMLGTNQASAQNKRKKQVIVHLLHTYLATRLLCWLAKFAKIDDFSKSFGRSPQLNHYNQLYCIYMYCFVCSLENTTRTQPFDALYIVKGDVDFLRTTRPRVSNF